MAALEAQLAEVQRERDALRSAYHALKHELELLKRRIYVASAERIDTHQLKLEFNEKLAVLNQMAETLDVDANTIAFEREAAALDEGAAGAQKRDGRKHRKTPPTGRRKLEDIDEATLPVVRVEVTDPLFEQLVAEGKAERVSSETSSKIGYERGGFRRVVTERVTYAATNTRGETELETAALPAELLPRCIATADTLAHILVAKYCDGLPLYRLEQIFDRTGIGIARGLMSRWVAELGSILGATVVRAARQEALATAFVLATDATGFAIQPGPADDGKRRPCRRGHYFALIADRDPIFFEFHPMFELDAEYRKNPPAKVKQLRDRHLRPHVEAFLDFVAAEYSKVQHQHQHQRGTLRSALGYCVRQREALLGFLNDGRLRMDNNHTENTLRKVVKIRDVALFAGSDDHAASAGHILSLVASACLHDLDPEAYLRDLIRVLPFWPRDRYLELAPKYWAETRRRLDPEQLRPPVGVIDPPPADAP